MVLGVDELFTLMLEELHQLPTDQAKAVESFVLRRWFQSSIPGKWFCSAFGVGSTLLLAGSGIYKVEGCGVGSKFR